VTRYRYIWRNHGEQIEGGRFWSEATRKLKVYCSVYSESWQSRKPKQYCLDVVGGVHCSWCMLNWVYARFSIWYTWCMLYALYAVLTINSCWWHGNADSDDWTLCSAMTVTLWMNMREVDNSNEYEMEGMTGYEESVVRLPRVSWEDRVALELRTRSMLLPAITAMGKWLPHIILRSLSISWWFPWSTLSSLFLALKSTITPDHKLE